MPSIFSGKMGAFFHQKKSRAGTGKYVRRTRPFEEGLDYNSFYTEWARQLLANALLGPACNLFLRLHVLFDYFIERDARIKRFFVHEHGVSVTARDQEVVRRDTIRCVFFQRLAACLDIGHAALASRRRNEPDLRHDSTGLPGPATWRIPNPAQCMCH